MRRTDAFSNLELERGFKIKRFVVAVIFAALGIFALRGQDKWVNTGFDWEKFGALGEASRSIKLTYLVGLADGYKAGRFYFPLKYMEGKGKEYFAQNPDVVPDMAKDALHSDLLTGIPSMGQAVDGVDDFYKDYANKHIPIFEAAILVCKRIRGETKEEEIQKELIRLRTFYKDSKR